MGGTAKNYQPIKIWQNYGLLWVLGTAPSGNLLTLASDGSPDSVTHGTCVFQGAAASALTTAAKPKLSEITIDQADAPVDAFSAEMDAMIEGELAQITVPILQQLLGVGVYLTGSGYQGLTFGGIQAVPQFCVAVISPRRENTNQYVVSCQYKAISTGGFALQLGRAKPAYVKFKFEGLTDYTRTAGAQIGVIYQTLANASGGTPTAYAITPSQIWEGPVDWWIVSPAPTDSAKFVTLDAATLTPDSTAHSASVHLGLTNGAADFSVVPKIDVIRSDQFDGGVDAVVTSVAAKLTGEWEESLITNLQTALGVGTYNLNAGVSESLTYGGNVAVNNFCIAAIGSKRAAPTKAAVCCLYLVNSKDGVNWAASKKKPSYYKVEFDGLADITRTAGRQIGNYFENV